MNIKDWSTALLILCLCPAAMAQKANRDAAFQTEHICLQTYPDGIACIRSHATRSFLQLEQERENASHREGAVVFDMALNTLLATVYIPNFYELVQKLQEKFSSKKRNS
ncbi:hypothetical protein [uncultured Bacteroides sp.]|uniref:hypothetical protein n=1 Tax=uncultured Bacteroides sp. TaxID=162156 RepID=UPI00259665DC|nr:hypothetical protein [uncultured Bacteroides sp.]